MQNQSIDLEAKVEEIALLKDKIGSMTEEHNTKIERYNIQLEQVQNKYETIQVCAYVKTIE